jgi:hypothetical protein
MVKTTSAKNMSEVDEAIFAEAPNIGMVLAIGRKLIEALETLKVPGFVISDVRGNVSKIENWHGACFDFDPKVLLATCVSRDAKPPGRECFAEWLMWLLRAFRFSAVAFMSKAENPFQHAYDEVYGSKHGMLIRPLAKTALLAAPKTMDAVYEKLGGLERIQHLASAANTLADLGGSMLRAVDRDV